MIISYLLKHPFEAGQQHFSFLMVEEADVKMLRDLPTGTH